MQSELLDLPFFDESHRRFATELRRWADAQKPFDAADPDEACARWVRALAEGNWLHSTAELEVRKLCIAREILAYHDALADFSFAMQGLGSAPVTLFGTKEQKERLTDAVISGKTIPAFALTEREAGSDVGAIEMRARREGSDYILDGEKSWISNAGIAGVYVAFARTAGTGTRGLSAFVVEAQLRGVTVTQRVETISPHPLGCVRFDRVRVPEDARIGEEGDGFKIAMATLDVFRSTVGAAATGFGRRALDETLAHVTSRKLFGSTLAALQLTQSKIAHMATDLDAAWLLVCRAAYLKDSGRARITREAAMAKWFATEAASRAVDEAVQLFGARGVSRGEIVERLYRDVRALRIYEGASEIQQVVIARSLVDAR